MSFVRAFQKYTTLSEIIGVCNLALIILKYFIYVIYIKHIELSKKLYYLMKSKNFSESAKILNEKIE